MAKKYQYANVITYKNRPAVIAFNLVGDKIKNYIVEIDGNEVDEGKGKNRTLDEIVQALA